MTDLEIKERILEIFNKQRQNPDSYFDESHFLDFLTYPAHSKNSIKNTFKGVRKYYRFMDNIELEFGICFTISDLDKYYSIENLIKKIKERLDKKRGNMIILKQRNEEKPKYILEMVLVLIIIIMFVWLGFHWLSTALTLVFGTVIYWTLSSKFHNRRHLKNLNILLRKEK